MTIRLVGRFAVLADGTTLDSGVAAAARSRRILAALVLAGPAGLSASGLASRVWAEPPATWPNALRGAIASLRHALAEATPAPVVVTTGAGWALAPGVRTDLDDVREALAAGTVPGEASARDFLAGTPLPDDDAAWLVDLRTEHGRLRARLHESVAEAALADGRPDDAIETALALLAVDPLDERAHRLHMRARLAAGDRAGAIEAFERCRSALAEELGVDPSPETAALHLDVLRSGAASARALPPLPAGGFFGRGRELAALTAALATPGTVVLLGRGGIGKSRLALHASYEAAERLPSRHWASLGDVGADELVATTVAAALGADTTGDPAAQAVERLANGPALLVLDGCERVADGAAELIAVLSEALPDLRVIATSRVPIGVAGAARIDVPPLPVAQSTEPIAEAAVQLLVDRVAALGGRLRIDPRSLPHLTELCARCEGVPLALELAAGQLAAMAVADLLDALGPVTVHAGDVLRTLLQQSIAALHADEKAVFERLAVIDGRVPLALVRRMAAAAVPAGRVARVLGELDGGALVHVDRTGTRWRYGVDDELRLLARGTIDDGTSRVALDGLAAALEEIAPADPREPPAPYREAVDDAADGFRTLFGAAAGGGFDRERALALAFRLHRYWTLTRLVEGRYWLNRLLEHAADGPAASRARFAAGYLGYWAGDGAALPLLRRAAVELEADEPASAARAAMFAAGLADDIDDGQGARVDIVTATRLAALAGGGPLLMNTTVGAAAIVAERGDRAAIGFLDRALELQGDAEPDQVHAALANAARIAWHVGDPVAARRYAAGAMPLLDGPPRIAQVQLACALAGLAFADGRLEEAAALAESAVAAATTLHLDRETPLTNALAARIAAAQGRADDAVHFAGDCLAVARRSEGTWQAALALETAAVVVPMSAEDRGMLLATAAGIRTASDRPAPADLGVADLGSAAIPVSDALAHASAVVAAERV